jgi:hypothetical protein
VTTGAAGQSSRADLAALCGLANSNLIKGLFKSSLSLKSLRLQGLIVRHDRSGP